MKLPNKGYRSVAMVTWSLATVMAAPLALAAGSCSREQELANKKIVESTLAKGPAAAFDLIDPDYIQQLAPGQPRATTS